MNVDCGLKLKDLDALLCPAYGRIKSLDIQSPVLVYSSQPPLQLS